MWDGGTMEKLMRDSKKPDRYWRVQFLIAKANEAGDVDEEIALILENQVILKGIA